MHIMIMTCFYPSPDRELTTIVNTPPFQLVNEGYEYLNAFIAVVS